MMVTNPETFNLLIVEDDKSEQKLINMIVKNSGYPSSIKFLNDGAEAIEYFNSLQSSKNIFNNLHLIMLDLNLPKVNGIDVLKKIRQNEDLKFVPVIVLTTSNNKSDVIQAYEAGAYGYIRKPSTIDEYEKIITHVLDYWLGSCKTV